MLLDVIVRPPHKRGEPPPVFFKVRVDVPSGSGDEAAARALAGLAPGHTVHGVTPAPQDATRRPNGLVVGDPESLDGAIRAAMPPPAALEGQEYTDAEIVQIKRRPGRPRKNPPLDMQGT